jgi:hypothetical protein
MLVALTARKGEAKTCRTMPNVNPKVVAISGVIQPRRRHKTIYVALLLVFAALVYAVDKMDPEI